MKNEQRGFICLNVTQFFGAANDNILKQVMVYGVAAGGIWVEEMGRGGQAIASLALSVPFVLLSGYAGQFSDRYSKQRVAIISKLSEIIIALLAMGALLLSNVWLLLGALILISIQSTFFSPAKYGILPELLEENKLSRANGTINMFTYVAVILGVAAGGPIYDGFAPEDPEAGRMLWLPGVVLLSVAVLGTVAAFGIPKLPAKDPKFKIRPLLFRPYRDTWADIKGTPLASVIIAWSYFYMIVAGMAMMILPDYKELLHISATKNSYLLGLLGIAIGLGDFAAGVISGHRIRPKLIAIGSIGSTIMFFVLGVIPLNFTLIAVCLGIAGFVAGFYMVPLQTMTQQLSSETQRGGVLGLWNCGSFVGIIVGSIVFYILRQIGMPSNRIFLVCGLLALVTVVLYFVKWQKMFIDAVNESEKQVGKVQQVTDSSRDESASDVPTPIGAAEDT